ncbi:hypothetical protein [Bradyrhizobium frederickii]|uniref:hypothetical protein n=1 Tax=Bradyrhizobium frederickii TaxID=2560054 RepID=UPI001430315B|nr:hypothetical protein [Bradyrhizobium frederickii]
MMVIIWMCLNSGLSSEDASAVLLPIVSSSALSAGSAAGQQATPFQKTEATPVPI